MSSATLKLATQKQRLSPEDTPQGELPPFEAAKAYAFDVALSRIEEVTGQSACALLGQSKGSFIAANVTVKGGGRPSEQAIFQNIARCKEQKGGTQGRGQRAASAQAGSPF